LGSPQGPNIIDWPKILAVGIVSPAATVVTSRFGVAGTLLGLALSAVFITAAVDVLKVYLARIPGAVTTTIPAGGLRKKPFLRRIFGRTKVPFGKFASLPRARRRSILMRGVVAAGVSIVVGLIVVTALEFGVGKSLSCWVWEECPKEEPSAEGGSGRTARASTLPSVLGGGQRAGGSSSVPQEEEEEGPSDLRQQQPGARQQPGVQQQQPGVQQQPGSSPAGTPPQAPSQQAPPPPRPAAGDPSVQRQQQPGQRQGPSGVPTGEEQQQAPPGAAPEDEQQQPTPGAAPEEEQPLGEGEQPPGAANP
jgi:hypothetical protein